MNKVELIGRLVREPEVRYSTREDPITIARFTVAVKRRFVKQGEEASDFIPCIAFRRTAEFCEKYFSKGMRVGIIGRIQTGKYTNKQGQTVYTMVVVVEDAEFLDAPQNEWRKHEDTPMEKDRFINIPDNIETPFD